MVCSHNMPSPRSCVDCMEEGPVERPAKWWKVGLEFLAQYDGTCVGCDEPIEVGDRVQKWDFGTETHAHQGCGL